MLIFFRRKGRHKFHINEVSLGSCYCNVYFCVGYFCLKVETPAVEK